MHGGSVHQLNVPPSKCGELSHLFNATSSKCGDSYIGQYSNQNFCSTCPIFHPVRAGAQYSLQCIGAWLAGIVLVWDKRPQSSTMVHWIWASEMTQDRCSSLLQMAFYSSVSDLYISMHYMFDFWRNIFQPNRIIRHRKWTTQSNSNGRQSTRT